MHLDRGQHQGVPDQGDDDVVRPEAEGHELDQELLNRAGPDVPAGVSFPYWGKQEETTPNKLCDDKQYSIDSVETHELVDEGVEVVLENLRTKRY